MGIGLMLDPRDGKVRVRNGERVSAARSGGGKGRVSTDSPVTESNAPTSERTRQWGEWLALATVILAVLGMFFSSPRFAGPDENAHQATAWYTIEQGLPPRSEANTPVPTAIPVQPCFAFYPEQDSACLGPRVSDGTAEVRTFNYPPVYYWITGSGQRVASAVSEIWLDLGGRLASVIINAIGLILLALFARRVTQQWGTYLLLVTTPMAAFLWSVVNPSGWEITTALLFAFFFARAWWSMGTPALPLLAVTSLLFGLSRHSALVWLVLLVIAVMLMGRSPARWSQRLWILAAASPGVVAGILWQITHPAQHPLWNPYPVENPGPLDYISWLGQIDNALSDRVRQMIGVLGWMDTPIPEWMMYAFLAAWAGLIGVIYARARIPGVVLAFGFVVSVIIPSAIEVVRWNDWPYWYQGRITLPFTLAFLFVLLVRFGYSSRKPAIAVSLIVSGVLAFMVWQNLMRNSFGIKGYLPVRLDNPAVEPPMYWASWFIIVVLVGVTATRAWLLRRESHHKVGSPPETAPVVP